MPFSEEVMENVSDSAAKCSSTIARATSHRRNHSLDQSDPETEASSNNVRKFTVTNSRQCEIPSSRTSESDFASWISSSMHFEFASSRDDDTTATSMRRSLHFANLIALTSYRFRTPGDVAPLSSRWREIQGANNWTGILNPLDLELRKELLRYGDFATHTYDNFESETRSRYAGSARFQKQRMFEKLHKRENGYQVTRYLYATCENPLPRALQFSEGWDVESNWMGYVAVATEKREIERLGRRDIVVAWRGTVRTIEWLVDAEIQMVPVKINEAETGFTKMIPKVENGFWSLYTCKRSTSRFKQINSASEQVIVELTRLLTLYDGENLSITLTGHSLGGALAILTAYEIASRGLVKSAIPVTVFTFGSPHVGNGDFRRKFEEMNIKALRVVEAHDLVPKTMPKLYNFPWKVDSYKHVGVALRVDHTRSPYLKPTRDPKDFHNMEAYLHLVDGHQGERRRFELVTGRDYALVNKYADLLRESLGIPPFWWQIENKGLELSVDGRWREPDRAWEDAPSLVNQERYV